MTAKKTHNRNNVLHHYIPRASFNSPLSLSLTQTPHWRVPCSIERAKLFLSYSNMFVVNRPACIEAVYEGLNP